MESGLELKSAGSLSCAVLETAGEKRQTQTWRRKFSFQPENRFSGEFLGVCPYTPTHTTALVASAALRLLRVRRQIASALSLALLDLVLEL